MILVVGGAGYIGSHMVRHLCDNGESVVVLDNLTTGSDTSIDPRATFVLGSCGDVPVLDYIFKAYKIEAVFHFASSIYVEESEREPLKYFENNVAKTITLLKAMKSYDVDKFIFSSTAAIYGHSEAFTPLTEHLPSNPCSTYGHTKSMVEIILQRCSEAWGLRYAALRYFNAAGAQPDGSLGENHDPEPHLIPTILKKVLATKEGRFPTVDVYGMDYDTKDGTCIRDYVHVCDLADAHYKCLERLRNYSEPLIYNLGCGVGYSILDVLHACSIATGMPITHKSKPRRKGDPGYLVADTSKIRVELGWEPIYPLDAIVRTAWEWHKKSSK